MLPAQLANFGQTLSLQPFPFKLETLRAHCDRGDRRGEVGNGCRKTERLSIGPTGASIIMSKGKGWLHG